MKQAPGEGREGFGGVRRRTSSSSFGVGRRESHDSSDFYARFTAPELSSDTTINKLENVDEIYLGDARDMSAVASSSVALVVTSPPYFVGKEYEEALGEGHVPGSYLEYLQLLEDVFAECVRVLEPGGRIAVNVANLGRRPYRSLSADVIAILQDRLRLLLRGEVVWQKGAGASGSCAWGSFQSAHNPVLRDLTERVVIASKGRFDRAISRRDRHKRELPSEASIFKDEFMEATLDVWDFPPESATRLNHPAPFPVELPKRLIELYTYLGDVVLDPFAGSGSTAVAAVRTDRHFLGFEIDPAYRDAALERVGKERAGAANDASRKVRLPVDVVEGAPDSGTLATLIAGGARAKEVAAAQLQEAGFQEVKLGRKVGHGLEVDLTAVDAKGRRWDFDVLGAFSSSRPGLRRMETMWRALGKAAVLRATGDEMRLVLLSTDLPPRGTPGERVLKASRGDLFYDAIELLSSEGSERLKRYALGEESWAKQIS